MTNRGVVTMDGLTYTQEFVLCVLNQKPKISAFKNRKVAACLLLSEIVELLKAVRWH